jgi:NADH-quinone oxidoreductase subunit K
MISLFSYLIVSAILFLIGLIVILSRKNIIAVLLGLELILNASAINFAAYSKFESNNTSGYVFSLFIIAIAAAEAAVGLAIIIRHYQIRQTLHLDEISDLKE